MASTPSLKEAKWLLDGFNGGTKLEKPVCVDRSITDNPPGIEVEGRKRWECMFPNNPDVIERYTIILYIRKSDQLEEHEYQCVGVPV